MEDKSPNQTLVLIGAGHAHLGVIDDWRGRGPPQARTLLVEPREAMEYSGMLPGWLAGEYRAEEAMIPLAPLVEETGIEWRKACAVGIDPIARTVRLDDGSTVAFDLCLIATGGMARAARILGQDERLLDIRPIHRFIERWAALRDGETPPRRIAVVGGGAGGIELAFGLRNAAGIARPEVALVAGAAGLAADHSRAVRERAATELARQGIAVIAEDARFVDGELLTGERSLEPLDLVVAAIGSGAPAWPAQGGLPVDEDGFIRVDEHQRAPGFPHIFAAGDVARRIDRHVPHSGVHAVYAGPVLAKNLRAALAGRESGRSYSPRFMDFYLLNTCRGESILSYGRLGLRGRWLRRLKDWLDRRWIARFRNRAG